MSNEKALQNLKQEVFDIITSLDQSAGIANIQAKTLALAIQNLIDERIALNDPVKFR